MARRAIETVQEQGVHGWTLPFVGIQLVACVGLAVAAFQTDGFARIAIVFALLLIMSILLLSTILARKSAEELNERSAMVDAARGAHEQVEELFAMTDMLQAAEDHDDAGAVLMATSMRLLPDFGGALYVFNNSRDRLDLAKSWNADGFSPSETLLPGNCWALKRGKPHINDPATRTLCCMHHIDGGAATIEVPMMARGQVHGLIMLSLEAEDAMHQLKGVRRIAVTGVFRPRRSTA